MQLPDLNFQQWIEFFFDPEDKKLELSEQESIYKRLRSDLPIEKFVDYTIATFENHNRVLSDFQNWQIDEGLSSILDWWVFAKAAKSSWKEKKRILASMPLLFEGIFSNRCERLLSHQILDEESSKPVNGICYMWWDIIWYSARNVEKSEPTIFDRECIEMMAKILEIEHIACQESALHGLGHWHRKSADLVIPIVDRFIETHPDLPTDLKQYANDARIGHVL